MRSMLFWGAAASVMLGATRAPAQTQDESKEIPTAASDNTPVLQEVLVTGVRRSLENAIAAKRDADTVVDAISAEDVGKFPTENVAESLQRVTGVQISRLRGEGQNVTIRGLPSDFTLVQLNGRSLTSALGPSGSTVGRSFDFTILPSEFVSRVEVFKTPSADLEEGGLAGTVIARTVRPLDVGKRKFAGNIEGASESNRDEWAPRASAFYTDVFADGKVGVSLGAAYTKRLTETHEHRITRFRRATEAAQGGLDLNDNGIVEDGKAGRPLNTTSYAMLDSIFQTLFREDRERKTFMGTVQFQPNDHWEFVADGFYGKVDLFSPRYTDLIRIGIGLRSGGPVVPGSIVLNQRPGNSSAVGDKGLPANTIEAGEFQGVDQRADGRTEQREGNLGSFSLGGTFHGEGIKVSTEVGYSKGTQVMYNPLLENTRWADVAYDVRVNPDLISYHFGGADDAARLDPSTFRLLGFNGEWGTRREDKQKDISIDADKDFSWGVIEGLRFGGRYADRSTFGDNRRIAATSTQLAALWNGGTPQLFLKEISPSTGTFLDANGNTSSLYPQSWLVNDPFAFVNAYGREAIEAVSTITNDPTGINDVDEKSGALYLRADLAHFDGRLTGNIGVRVVRTEQTSTGVSPDLNGITFEPQAGSITRVPSAAPLTVDRHYIDTLPSLNLKFDLTEEILLRFAASRTMSRPTLTQISPSVGASGTAQTITANNPQLDPFRSNNFDLSGEWYFSEGGLLAATVFYKDIVSLVTRVQTQIPLTITQINGDGSRQPVNQIWTLSSLENGPGTAVSGIEFSYQQNFDFLPGPLKDFGFLGNYTYLENHGSVPLSGASRNNYTASLYYERGRFGGRVAYTYRGRFYVDVEGNSQDTRFNEPFGTLDANVTLNVTDNVSLLLEATNILQDTDRTVFEPIDLPADTFDSGRRVLIGLRGSF